jgi:D-3-phosphoglycerate dehydrogenase
VNIAGQYYQTVDDIGYVVIEADEPGPVADDILADIRALPETIRARIIYERR